MELTQLRYFLLVAEHKKISKAAILAFTSQSNLSKQIAQLETALDCQLFERTNSGVELTNAGKYLYKELKPVLAKLDRIFENVQKQEKDHPIRISTCSNLDVEQGCPSLFKKIRERTDIEIHLESDSFDALIDKLLLQQLDAGFLFSNFDTTAPEIRRKALNRLPPLVYYSASHPLAHKEGLCLDDFRNETFVVMRDSFVSRNLFHSLHFTPPNVISTNSIDAIYSYILSGEAVSVLGQNQSIRSNKNVFTMEIQTDDREGIDIAWNIHNKNPRLEELQNIIEEIYREQQMRKV